jgi:hypothetical protein
VVKGLAAKNKKNGFNEKSIIDQFNLFKNFNTTVMKKITNPFRIKNKTKRIPPILLLRRGENSNLEPSQWGKTKII